MKYILNYTLINVTYNDSTTRFSSSSFLVFPYLDVNFHTESFRLTEPVADVDAEDVLLGLRFKLVLLDVRDMARCKVLHRERHVRGDDM